MSRDHLLVIDQGTTSTRAVVYDNKLKPVGQSQLEVSPSYPRSGWVEHDPQAILASVRSQVPLALDSALRDEDNSVVRIQSPHRVQDPLTQQVEVDSTALQLQPVAQRDQGKVEEVLNRAVDARDGLANSLRLIAQRSSLHELGGDPRYVRQWIKDCLPERVANSIVEVVREYRIVMPC